MKKKNSKEIKNRKNKALIKRLIKNIDKGSKYYKNRDVKDVLSECSSIVMKCRRKNTFKMNKIKRIQRMIYIKIKNLNN